MSLECGCEIATLAFLALAIVVLVGVYVMIILRGGS